MGTSSERDNYWLYAAKFALRVSPVAIGTTFWGIITFGSMDQ
jgi:hypothetical protein